MRDLNSRDLEKYILSSILNDPKAIYFAASKLKREDFSSEIDREVFEAMLALNAEQVPIDIQTVETKLKMMGRKWQIEQKYLYELFELLASAANVEHWVSQLMEMSSMRKLKAMLARLQKMIEEDAGAAPNDIIEKNTKWLSDIMLSRQEKDFRDAAEITSEIIADISDDKPLTGHFTGFAQLDSCMRKGLKNKQMIVLAAPPGVGKTAFALNLSVKLASEKKNVAFINMEMEDKDLQTRNICSKAFINSDNFVTKSFSAADIAALQRGVKEVSLPNLHILDMPDLSIEQIMRKCEFLRLRKGLDFLVIDYINLIRIENENRAIGVGEVSRKIKVLAGSLDIPILVLAQMNREMFRKNEEPDLHHLRDSGNIEQDADVVWFMTRKDKTDSETKFKIAKNRNGRCGSFSLEYVGEYFLFRDWTVRHLPDPEGFLPVS